MSQKKWTDAFKSKNNENENNNVDNNEISNEENETEELSKTEELIKKLTEENLQIKDKFLRTVAELENTRRIAYEEKEKTIKFAITNFSNDLIPIMENFFLAFKNSNPEEINKIFYDGITLTFNELKKAFEKNKIVRIFPLKEKFNPDFHEAIAHIESDEDEGIIVDVLQAGYTLNGRVLRPSLVTVSKGK